jgi:hypothetical protein
VRSHAAYVRSLARYVRSYASRGCTSAVAARRASRA